MLLLRNISYINLLALASAQKKVSERSFVAVVGYLLICINDWRTNNQESEDKKLVEIGTVNCPECNSKNVQSLDL